MFLSALDDVQAAGEAVGDVDQAVGCNDQVVELDAVAAGGWVGHEVGDFAGPGYVGNIHHAQASVEPRYVDLVRIDQAAWPHLVDVVWPKTSPARAEIALGYGKFR